MLQLGLPVGGGVVPVMQVTCVPDTETLLQPLMLKVTSARARDEYIAATANIVMPIQNANRGRPRTDGFDGFISTPVTPLPGRPTATNVVAQHATKAPRRRRSPTASKLHQVLYCKPLNT